MRGLVVGQWPRRTNPNELHHCTSCTTLIDTTRILCRRPPSPQPSLESIAFAVEWLQQARLVRQDYLLLACIPFTTIRTLTRCRPLLLSLFHRFGHLSSPRMSEPSARRHAANCWSSAQVGARVLRSRSSSAQVGARVLRSRSSSAQVRARVLRNHSSSAQVRARVLRSRKSELEYYTMLSKAHAIALGIVAGKLFHVWYVFVSII